MLTRLAERDQREREGQIGCSTVLGRHLKHEPFWRCIHKVQFARVFCIDLKKLPAYSANCGFLTIALIRE